MSVQENENIAIVRRWFEEIWNQRRLETIDELFGEDGVAHDLGGPGASVRGPAAFRAAAEQLHQIFGEMHLKIEDIIGAGDKVAIRLTSHLKHTGALGGLPPTGREITVPIMCMIHLRDGKLVEGWNFWDVSAALRTAGAPQEKTTLF